MLTDHRDDSLTDLEVHDFIHTAMKVLKMMSWWYATQSHNNDPPPPSKYMNMSTAKIRKV